MPELKDLPSSLVTVWGAWVILVQVTFVPTLMVSVAGLKAKLPLLSVVNRDGLAVARCGCGGGCACGRCGGGRARGRCGGCIPCGCCGGRA